MSRPAAIANPEGEVKTVGGPFMDLRLFRAAIAITRVEVKAVNDPFMDLRLFRAAIVNPDRRSRSRQ